MSIDGFKRQTFSLSHNAGGNGWRHNFTFYAFDKQRPGTTAFGVGHANCGKCQFRKITFALKKG